MKVSITVPGKFHAFDLARQLEKRGLSEKIITSYPRWKLKDEHLPQEKIITMPSIEVLSRGFRRTPLRHVFNSHFLTSEIFDRRATRKIGDCDVCVSWAGYGLHIIRAAKKRGIKTILERGSSHIEHQQKIMKEEYNRLGKRFEQTHPRIIQKELKEYEEADYIAIPSMFVKHTFMEKGIPESKLIHVPYGVDLTRFKQIPKEDDVFRVIFAGGMRIRKGVHYLLQAFSELNLPHTELLLIGSLDEEMKEAFVKHRGSFKWMGHVPQEKLHEHLSQGSAFAICSLEEGLALVQAQAMACGLPIICTENTGGEDIVRDGKDGFVLPVRDIKTLKEKILYLYKNPGVCKSMGESAKERVQAGFTWDDYGEKIIKEYERIYNENR